MHTRIMAVALVFLGFIAFAGQPPTIWYVDDDGDEANGCTSWNDACPELQTALGRANFDDQIWVAVGTYKPDFDVDKGQHTGDREATFQLISGVAIYGGFDGTEATIDERAGLFEQTILTGDLNGDDVPVPCSQDSECNIFGYRCLDGSCGIDQNVGENVYHVTTGSGTDATALLNGFAITGGNARPTRAGSNFAGGGMLNNGGGPAVINCIFIRNTAFIGGGGMVNANSSDPIVSNCTFSRNTTVGVPHVGGWGGGMGNQYSSPSVTNCAFTENYGPLGGGMVNDHSSPTMINCTFSENSAGGGGGLYNVAGSPTMINCSFTGNTTIFEGGGIYNVASSPTITNCTFNGNSASGGGAVFNHFGSNPTVTNSIVWDNTPGQINGPSAVSYSNVQGGWPGEGNIDADPLFVDSGYWDDNGTPEDPDDDFWVDGDYHLLQGSPCIDAADNTAVPEGIVTDLDGNPRFVDDPHTDDTGFGDPPIVDMGSYEVQDPCADDDGDGRITICHIPPGNPDNAHTITVNVNAVPAHLAHGDYCGPCEGDSSAHAGTTTKIDGKR